MAPPDQQKRIDKLAYWMLKSVNKAVYEFEMISDGDRVAVAVSGGKDSLTLLKLLDKRRASAREKYSLSAIHLSGDGAGPLDLPNPKLIDWLDASGVPYITRPFFIPNGDTLPLNCHRCAWNRRKQLFEIANEMDCNVIALGHHADDLAETTLMNLLFHGRAETMPPVKHFFGGIFKVIRPMAYLPEKEITKFSRICGFPADDALCPLAYESQRQTARDFLTDLVRQHPDIRLNLLRAGLKGIGVLPDKLTQP
jgi:tRNA(Ile)-lysidine synthase TilS/MesJ